MPVPQLGFAERQLHVAPPPMRYRVLKGCLVFQRAPCDESLRVSHNRPMKNGRSRLVTLDIREDYGTECLLGCPEK